MNPIAFMAFLVGINSTPPAPPPTVAEQKQKVEKPQPKPGKGGGAQKRGGWDHN